MTNRELLEKNHPHRLLTGIERQRLHLLQTDGVPMPCPNCATHQNLFQAAGVDVDDYDFGATKLSYACQGCGRELRQVVPFVSMAGPGWHWGLVPIPVETQP